MPLPLIIGIAAGLAGAAGVGSGIHGAVKMKEANDTAKSAQRRNEENLSHLEDENKKTMKDMDRLGEKEMEILSTFQRFSAAFEKIKNRPSFAQINKSDVKLPEFSPKDIKDAGVGATALLGGLSGAGLGTAGGFAAAGGTTAAVTALGTASTGTPIFALAGAAKANAILAALGGGSLATGGGGVALGSAILGGATLGAGLLVGGIIFNIAGSSVSDKADNAWRQMLENEEKINSICEYLNNLRSIAKKFNKSLVEVDNVYEDYLERFVCVVDDRYSNARKLDYNDFDQEEKSITENIILLVGLLYNMCKVQIVEKNNNEEESQAFAKEPTAGEPTVRMAPARRKKDEGELNKINETAVYEQIENAEKILQQIQVA